MKCRSKIGEKKKERLESMKMMGNAGCYSEISEESKRN